MSGVAWRVEEREVARREVLARALLKNRTMAHTAESVRFTRQTLSWFDEGEAIAASERETAAELASEPDRVRYALGVAIVLAILVCAALALVGF
jgi:hypothetical protein